MRLAALLGLVLAVAATGCGGDAAAERTAAAEAGGSGWTMYIPLEPEAAKLLAGLNVAGRPLDAEALADDALDREALTSLLRESAFVGGAEREYSGRTKTFSHVISRVLEFEDRAGADAYLGWLDANAADIIGKVKAREPLALADGGTLFLEQGCGCHSDLPTFLAAWRRGQFVQTVLADGPGVDRKLFERLVRIQARTDL